MEQQARRREKQRETAYVQDETISANLARLAKRRTDIFGGDKQAEEEQVAPAVIWDGVTADPEVKQKLTMQAARAQLAREKKARENAVPKPAIGPSACPPPPPPLHRLPTSVPAWAASGSLLYHARAHTRSRPWVAAAPTPGPHSVRRPGTRSTCRRLRASGRPWPRIPRHARPHGWRHGGHGHGHASAAANAAGKCRAAAAECAGAGTAGRAGRSRPGAAPSDSPKARGGPCATATGEAVARDRLWAAG